MEIPEPPEKFNWHELKAWLNTIRSATLTNQVKDGAHIHSNSSPDGSVVNAEDCPPCS